MKVRRVRILPSSSLLFAAFTMKGETQQAYVVPGPAPYMRWVLSRRTSLHNRGSVGTRHKCLPEEFFPCGDFHQSCLVESGDFVLNIHLFVFDFFHFLPEFQEIFLGNA